ncbi:hypothetical protein [Campylobacter troglodytis]|nr:hypothetical protein [Campylobacter troglodytis]
MAIYEGLVDFYFALNDKTCHFDRNDFAGLLSVAQAKKALCLSF